MGTSEVARCKHRVSFLVVQSVTHLQSNLQNLLLIRFDSAAGCRSAHLLTLTTVATMAVILLLAAGMADCDAAHYPERMGVRARGGGA